MINSNSNSKTKILIVSDIHIHDYPQRNPSEKYRLYQSRIVCQNIIQAGREQGCSVIVLAGDIVEKFLIRPYVQAEVKLFLDTLMSNFDMGYLIYGNHDQDNKGTDSVFTDSCLSVMLPKNLIYAHRTEIQVDGCRIGFCNWSPEFDLSWINGKLDVLITHATICYNPADGYHSQVLDESKFDLAICGDIHKPGTIGKYVSIGIPQRCKMSDGTDCTGVVLVPADKTWSWVNLNPNDNLMKFEYTDIREQEGWDQRTGTWKVYKPGNQSISGGTKDIQIPAWEEIGKLTEAIIVSNGLQEVHSEVIQNIGDIDKKEVDFNFVITRFACKNWRSIEELELYFGDRDKVLITGENGSGKSSLLSAIKYAFLENPHPKDLVQFGTKECWTEVEFLYQGGQHKILRGSKKYGYWIDGVVQKYNCKKDFEKDMHLRFPFIDYMDVYFYDSDHPRLIGDITPERKSEIISRFYKMDRIDAYNEQALLLRDKYLLGGSTWKDEITKSTQLLEYLETKISQLVLPQDTVEVLEQKRQVGIAMKEAWLAYNNYTTTSASLLARLDHLRQEEQQGQISIRNLRDPGLIKAEVDAIQAKISELTALSTELGAIKTEGRRLYAEKQGLGAKKNCPCCGQPIKDQGHLEKYAAELGAKIDELVMKQNETYNKFIALGIPDKSEIDSGCKNILVGYNKAIGELLAEKTEGTRLQAAYQEVLRSISETEKQIEALGKSPEPITLPDNFFEELGVIESQLAAWQTYTSLITDKQAVQAKVLDYQAKLDAMSQTVDAYNAYIKLTGHTGLIYQEIMTKLADQFSDNRVKYEVVLSTFRGKDHLNLESAYNLNGNNVRYVNCSDGQRTLLDVDFLSKVVTRVGLLVMDEFLKHLDPKNHDIVLDLVGQMNIGLSLISSHMESIPAFNNKSLRLELNDSGITKVTVK